MYLFEVLNDTQANLHQKWIHNTYLVFIISETGAMGPPCKHKNYNKNKYLFLLWPAWLRAVGFACS